MNCSPISLSALYPRYMRREYTFNVFLHSNRLYCFGPLGKLVQFEMKVFESIMKGKSLLLCTLGMLTCFFCCMLESLFYVEMFSSSVLPSPLLLCVIQDKRTDILLLLWDNTAHFNSFVYFSFTVKPWYMDMGPAVLRSPTIGLSSFLSFFIAPPIQNTYNNIHIMES